MHSCAFTKCDWNNFNNLASNNLGVLDNHILEVSFVIIAIFIFHEYTTHIILYTIF